MLTTTRARITALVATAAMSLAGTGVAQAQTNQEGLVNVSITDVQIPIGIAANVCQVSANVITAASGNQAGDCDAVSRPSAHQGGGGSTRQRGLVNVSVDDVQVPIGVAANICQVSVNVISEASGNQLGRCDAVTAPSANQ
jgi:hypothetical protein